ncbi:uncharacterized protein A4U43_UnF1580 [Asparagus officinalis]|uniref:Uncharacterized protein n=1 Tax=Asparagus officinalis TaxID=4686 RepID=A0A1R3L7H1_ASPOF|nr:uncharacterized protein A4U43_UnF1580 [Asparagus officinalis]
MTTSQLMQLILMKTSRSKMRQLSKWNGLSKLSTERASRQCTKHYVARTRINSRTLQAPWVVLICSTREDVNQLLFNEANKKSEDPPTVRASPQLFFTDIHKESEDAPPGEVPPPEAYRIDTALEAEINEGEKVSPPAKELLTCTEIGPQREGTGREITPAVDVPSAGPSTGHDTETQTCIG